MDAYHCEGLAGRGDERIGVIARPEGAGPEGNPTLLVAGRRGETARILPRRNARILWMRARLALSISSGAMSWGDVDMPELTSCHRLLRPRQRGSSLSPFSSSARLFASHIGRGEDADMPPLVDAEGLWVGRISSAGLILARRC